MYKIMAFISFFIRQFYIPNPFENIQNGELYNIISGVILYPITYIMVGIYYDEGEAPALGSFLYLVFYLVNTGILLLFALFKWNKLAMCIICIFYIAILSGIKKLQNSIIHSY